MTPTDTPRIFRDHPFHSFDSIGRTPGGQKCSRCAMGIYNPAHDPISMPGFRPCDAGVMAGEPAVALARCENCGIPSAVSHLAESFDAPCATPKCAGAVQHFTRVYPAVS